jgi:hypothetical protein
MTWTPRHMGCRCQHLCFLPGHNTHKSHAQDPQLPRWHHLAACKAAGLQAHKSHTTFDPAHGWPRPMHAHITVHTKCLKLMQVSQSTHASRPHRKQGSTTRGRIEHSQTTHSTRQRHLPTFSSTHTHIETHAAQAPAAQSKFTATDRSLTSPHCQNQQLTKLSPAPSRLIPHAPRPFSWG